MTCLVNVLSLLCRGIWALFKIGPGVVLKVLTAFSGVFCLFGLMCWSFELLCLRGSWGSLWCYFMLFKAFPLDWHYWKFIIITEGCHFSHWSFFSFDDPPSAFIFCNLEEPTGIFTILFGTYFHYLTRLNERYIPVYVHRDVCPDLSKTRLINRRSAFAVFCGVSDGIRGLNWMKKILKLMVCSIFLTPLLL